MRPIKVMIVDDHAMFVESLTHLLSTKERVNVVGVANSSQEALKRVEELRPDIVLMDIEMKGTDGIETTRLVKKRHPEIGVIILTMHEEEQYMIEAIRAGANGYIPKNSSCSSILDAIRLVQKGEFGFGSQESAKNVLSNIVDHLKYEAAEKESALSAQEVRILALIAEGYTNKDIGDKLYISVHTVRNHIANIFLKMGCSNRIRAVKEARRRKII